MRYLLALVALAACGNNNSHDTPDAAGGGDDAPPPDTGPAPSLDAPQSVSVGGPVTAAPVVVPIFFQGDTTMQTKIEGFLTALASSSYWTTTTSEYGIGALTVHATIVATDAAPATDAALQTWLAAQTDGTHAGWPTPDGNTIYAVFLPTASFTSSFGTACNDYGGYHDEGMATGGTKFIYALMPRCGSSADSLTITTSHELVEASSDPFPFTAGAYQLVDNPHFVWALMPGGELGDMCEYVANASQRLVGNYAVQRTWSNASAKAGHDPCVPVMSDPYQTAAPVFTEDLMIDPQDGTPLVPTKGVQVAMGESKTIEVDLFSDAPTTADWTVKAIDASSLSGSSPELTLALDTATGHNGDKLHLTITRTANGANGGSELVLSSRVNNHSVSLWWGYVAN